MRLMRLPWFIGVLGLIASSCSCQGDGEEHVIERVAFVKQLTLPSDATKVKESRPDLTRYGAKAHWDFETSKGKSVFLAWVDRQLEHNGFKLNSADESSHVFTGSSRQEGESVHILAIPFNGKLHVQIVYAIDSD